jgi:hypothetical protein
VDKYHYFVVLSGLGKLASTVNFKNIFPVLSHEITKEDIRRLENNANNSHRGNDNNFIWTVTFYSLLKLEKA